MFSRVVIDFHLITIRAHTGIVCSRTLTIGGQSVRRFPVFIAPQDVVGDVDVTGRHVVNPLGNSHTA